MRNTPPFLFVFVGCYILSVLIFRLETEVRNERRAHQTLMVYHKLETARVYCRGYQPNSHKGQARDISSVQSLSRVQLFANPWTTACQASLSITNSQSLLKLMSIESVMPSSHLILCLPLRLLPSIFPSIRVFFSESVLPIRWPKYWNFSFSISLSNEYSRLISFRIDSFDLLAVQRILKSLLQHHSSKVSILRHLEFFMIQPTLISIHDYWKNHGFD